MPLHLVDPKRAMSFILGGLSGRVLLENKAEKITRFETQILNADGRPSTSRAFFDYVQFFDEQGQERQAEYVVMQVLDGKGESVSYYNIDFNGEVLLPKMPDNMEAEKVIEVINWRQAAQEYINGVLTSCKHVQDGVTQQEEQEQKHSYTTTPPQRHETIQDINNWMKFTGERVHRYFEQNQNLDIKVPWKKIPNNPNKSNDRWLERGCGNTADNNFAAKVQFHARGSNEEQGRVRIGYNYIADDGAKKYIIEIRSDGSLIFAELPAVTDSVQKPRSIKTYDRGNIPTEVELIAELNLSAITDETEKAEKLKQIQYLLRAINDVAWETQIEKEDDNNVMVGINLDGLKYAADNVASSFTDSVHETAIKITEDFDNAGRDTILRVRKNPGDVAANYSLESGNNIFVFNNDGTWQVYRLKGKEVKEETDRKTQLYLWNTYQAANPNVLRKTWENLRTSPGIIVDLQKNLQSKIEQERAQQQELLQQRQNYEQRQSELPRLQQQQLQEEHLASQQLEDVGLVASLQQRVNEARLQRDAAKQQLQEASSSERLSLLNKKLDSVNNYKVSLRPSFYEPALHNSSDNSDLAKNYSDLSDKQRQEFNRYEAESPKAPFTLTGADFFADGKILLPKVDIDDQLPVPAVVRNPLGKIAPAQTITRPIITPQILSINPLPEFPWMRMDCDALHQALHTIYDEQVGEMNITYGKVNLPTGEQEINIAILDATKIKAESKEYYAIIDDRYEAVVVYAKRANSTPVSMGWVNSEGFLMDGVDLMEKGSDEYLALHYIVEQELGPIIQKLSRDRKQIVETIESRSAKREEIAQKYTTQLPQHLSADSGTAAQKDTLATLQRSRALLEAAYQRDLERLEQNFPPVIQERVSPGALEKPRDTRLHYSSFREVVFNEPKFSQDAPASHIFGEADLFYSNFVKVAFNNVDFRNVKSLETTSFGVGCTFENCTFAEDFKFKISQFFTKRQLDVLLQQNAKGGQATLAENSANEPERLKLQEKLDGIRKSLGKSKVETNDEAKKNRITNLVSEKLRNASGAPRALPNESKQTPYFQGDNPANKTRLVGAYQQQPSLSSEPSEADDSESETEYLPSSSPADQITAGLRRLNAGSRQLEKLLAARNQRGPQSEEARSEKNPSNNSLPSSNSEHQITTERLKAIDARTRQIEELLAAINQRAPESEQAEIFSSDSEDDQEEEMFTEEEVSTTNETELQAAAKVQAAWRGSRLAKRESVNVEVRKDGEKDNRIQHREAASLVTLEQLTKLLLTRLSPLVEAATLPPLPIRDERKREFLKGNLDDPKAENRYERIDRFIREIGNRISGQDTTKMSLNPGDHAQNISVLEKYIGNLLKSKEGLPKYFKDNKAAADKAAAGSKRVTDLGYVATPGEYTSVGVKGIKSRDQISKARESKVDKNLASVIKALNELLQREDELLKREKKLLAAPEERKQNDSDSERESGSEHERTTSSTGSTLSTPPERRGPTLSEPTEQRKVERKRRRAKATSSRSSLSPDTKQSSVDDAVLRRSTSSSRDQAYQQSQHSEQNPNDGVRSTYIGSLRPKPTVVTESPPLPLSFVTQRGLHTKLPVSLSTDSDVSLEKSNTSSDESDDGIPSRNTTPTVFVTRPLPTSQKSPVVFTSLDAAQSSLLESELRSDSETSDTKLILRKRVPVTISSAPGSSAYKSPSTSFFDGNVEDSVKVGKTAPESAFANTQRLPVNLVSLVSPRDAVPPLLKSPLPLQSSPNLVPPVVPSAAASSSVSNVTNQSTPLLVSNPASLPPQAASVAVLPLRGSQTPLPATSSPLSSSSVLPSLLVRSSSDFVSENPLVRQSSTVSVNDANVSNTPSTVSSPASMRVSIQETRLNQGSQGFDSDFYTALEAVLEILQKTQSNFVSTPVGSSEVRIAMPLSDLVRIKKRLEGALPQRAASSSSAAAPDTDGTVVLDEIRAMIRAEMPTVNADSLASVVPGHSTLSDQSKQVLEILDRVYVQPELEQVSLSGSYAPALVPNSAHQPLVDKLDNISVPAARPVDKAPPSRPQSALMQVVPIKTTSPKPNPFETDLSQLRPLPERRPNNLVIYSKEEDEPELNPLFQIPVQTPRGSDPLPPFQPLASAQPVKKSLLEGHEALHQLFLKAKKEKEESALGPLAKTISDLRNLLQTKKYGDMEVENLSDGDEVESDEEEAKENSDVVNLTEKRLVKAAINIVARADERERSTLVKPINAFSEDHDSDLQRPTSGSPKLPPKSRTPTPPNEEVKQVKFAVPRPPQSPPPSSGASSVPMDPKKKEVTRLSSARQAVLDYPLATDGKGSSGVFSQLSNLRRTTVRIGENVRKTLNDEIISLAGEIVNIKTKVKTSGKFTEINSPDKDAKIDSKSKQDQDGNGNLSRLFASPKFKIFLEAENPALPKGHFNEEIDEATKHIVADDREHCKEYLRLRIAQKLMIDIRNRLYNLKTIGVAAPTAAAAAVLDADKEPPLLQDDSLDLDLDIERVKLDGSASGLVSSSPAVFSPHGLTLAESQDAFQNLAVDSEINKKVAQVTVAMQAELLAASGLRESDYKGDSKKFNTDLEAFKEQYLPSKSLPPKEALSQFLSDKKIKLSSSVPGVNNDAVSVQEYILGECTKHISLYGPVELNEKLEELLEGATQNNVNQLGHKPLNVQLLKTVTDAFKVTALRELELERKGSPDVSAASSSQPLASFSAAKLFPAQSIDADAPVVVQVVGGKLESVLNISRVGIDAVPAVSSASAAAVVNADSPRLSPASPLAATTLVDALEISGGMSIGGRSSRSRSPSRERPASVPSLPVSTPSPSNPDEGDFI